MQRTRSRTGQLQKPDSYISAEACVETQDLSRDAWEKDSDGYLSSGSFELSGNTWKTLRIAPTLLTPTSELRWAMKALATGELQALGVGDGAGKQILYPKYGVEYPADSVSVLRGFNSTPTGAWHVFAEAVALDWYAMYAEWPVIRELYFVNDADEMSAPPTVRFDDVVISDSAPLSTSDGSSTYSHSFESLPTLSSRVLPLRFVPSSFVAPNLGPALNLKLQRHRSL